MNTKSPTVYIMTDKVQGTLYIGVTSDLIRRVSEHKEVTGSVFTSKYRCYLLVWYHSFETMFEAISAEKLLKMKSRLYKLQLIESRNPAWNDFSKERIFSVQRFPYRFAGNDTVKKHSSQKTPLNF